MARVQCDVCSGSGENPEHPYRSCMRCAGMGEHPEHTRASFSRKYRGACVDILSMEADPDEVICWAFEIDAAFEAKYGGEFVVIRYKGEPNIDTLYRVPHPYVPGELRSIFRFYRLREP